MLKQLQTGLIGLTTLSTMSVPTIPAYGQTRLTPLQQLAERDAQQAAQLGIVIASICENELPTRVIGNRRNGKPVQAYGYTCEKVYSVLYNFTVKMRQLEINRGHNYPQLRGKQGDLVAFLNSRNAQKECVRPMTQFLSNSAAVKKCDELIVMTTNLAQNQVRIADDVVQSEQIKSTVLTLGAAALFSCIVSCGGDSNDTALNEANRRAEEELAYFLEQQQREQQRRRRQQEEG